MLEPDKLKINVRIDMRHLLGHEIHVYFIFEVFVELDNVRVVLLMQRKDADENKCIKFRNYYCEKDGDKNLWGRNKTKPSRSIHAPVPRCIMRYLRVIARF